MVSSDNLHSPSSSAVYSNNLNTVGFTLAKRFTNTNLNEMINEIHRQRDDEYSDANNL